MRISILLYKLEIGRLVVADQASMHSPEDQTCIIDGLQQ